MSKKSNKYKTVRFSVSGYVNVAEGSAFRELTIFEDCLNTSSMYNVMSHIRFLQQRFVLKFGIEPTFFSWCHIEDEKKNRSNYVKIGG